METDSDQSKAIIPHNKGRCTYNAKRNIVLCPMGKVLYPKYYRQKIQSGIFYNYAACKQCECKCTVERYKKHQVGIKEEVFTKNYNDTSLFIKQIHIKADKEIVRKRKAIVEHPFGILKRANVNIDTIDAEMQKVIDQNEHLSKQISLLQSIPSIGLYSGIVILSKLGDIKAFAKPKQLVAFFGLDPTQRQSGYFFGTKN